MDRALKRYVTQTYRIGQRTLQRWMKAGVVPGVYRTKGGHYRIRKPKGLTEEQLLRSAATRAAIIASVPDPKVRLYTLAQATNHDVIARAFLDWAASVEKNVRDYRFLMKPLWGYERITGQKLPSRTLKELRVAVAKGLRIGIVEYVTARRAAKSKAASSPSSLSAVPPTVALPVPASVPAQ